MKALIRENWFKLALLILLTYVLLSGLAMTRHLFGATVYSQYIECLEANETIKVDRICDEAYIFTLRF